MASWAAGAVGMEVRRAVVALDDGDRAARPEQDRQGGQCLVRAGQVLEDEADEHVVERLGRERQVEDVRLPELDVGQPGGSSTLPAGLGDRLGGHVDGDEVGVRAAPGQGDRLGADAAPRLQHAAPGRDRRSPSCSRSTRVPAWSWRRSFSRGW